MSVTLKSARVIPTEREFHRSDFPILIGRSDDADIFVPDRWVSRRHCQLEWQDGLLVVRDLESTHGTYVNDQRVERAIMHPGDFICIGLTQFLVEGRFESPSDRRESVIAT